MVIWKKQAMMFTGPTTVEISDNAASLVIIILQHLSSSLNRLLFINVSEKLETALYIVTGAHPDTIHNNCHDFETTNSSQPSDDSRRVNFGLGGDGEKIKKRYPLCRSSSRATHSRSTPQCRSVLNKTSIKSLFFFTL